MLTIHLAILIPFLAAICIPIFHKLISRIHIGWFILIIPASLFIVLVRYIPSIANGDTFSHTIQWIPSFSINFTTYLDGLSMIFGLLITGIGALVILYSIYYMSKEESLKHFYFYLLLFMGSMLGVVFSDNIFVLYVFWELTSIASFLLIAFWYQRKGSRYGAKKALLITMSGGFAMLVGFIMLVYMTGTTSVREIIVSVSTLTDHTLFVPVMLLILLGAFTKSAQFPFHIWLPDAMEAPTPISAYLHSATMVKAGIFIVARFTPAFGGEALWFWLVCGVGLTTLFWGSFQAVRQTDLKALLAYSTISQLGLIMSLLGVSSLAFYHGLSVEKTLLTQAGFAALFHLVNHSTFKGALFMIVGILDFQVGTRDVRRLGGLMAIMPVSFTVALIGSFSMAGLPPFNGFLSKEMFFTAMLQVKQLEFFSLDSFGALLPVVAWVASVFTFVYSLIIVFQTFFGPHQQEKLETETKEASIGMIIAPVTLAALVVGIFFFPNVLGDNIIRPAMASIFATLPASDYYMKPISAWHGFNTELMMTIAIVIVGVSLYMLYKYWSRVYSFFPKSRSFDALYNNLVLYIEKVTSRITNSYMTGFLRDYFVYIFLFFIFVLGGALLFTDAISIDFSGDTPISTFVWIISVVMALTTIAILFVKSRLSAIVLTGLLGFGMGMLFVLFRAPDLALTQIIVESVTTALFLLCFTFLPKWEAEVRKLRTKILHIAISVSVGAIFIIIALTVKSGALFDSISVYFEDAYELAGGKNIVNTILGDFRAFDTMLEAVVLFIAGIGVYTLTKFKNGKEAKNLED